MLESVFDLILFLGKGKLEIIFIVNEKFAVCILSILNVSAKNIL